MAKAATKQQRAEIDEQLAELHNRIRHLDGCPEERLEGFPARNPHGDTILVARCVDCGEAEYE